MEFYTDIQE